MAAPLRSADPGQQKSMQFAHFGVLDAGTQSRASTITSLVLNLVIGFVIIVVSAATAKRTIEKKMLAELVVPITQKKVEPEKPKIVPPKPKIKLPELARIEPKITVPQIKLPDIPKQPVLKMETPKPIIAPPAPKQVIAPAAPVAVSLAHPTAASVPNHDAHPSAVGLGHPDSPINNLHGPAVASVNMGQGFPGMNGANTGHGPAATKVNFGNGSPGSTSLKGTGVTAVVGLPHGVTGGTGTSRSVGAVNLGAVAPPPIARPAPVVATAQGSAPTVMSKPKPEYTAEAKQMHIEGVVSIHIRVLTNGSVEVIGITRPLGYGLDDSAKRAILATRFKPATNASGSPIAWEGVVNVTFQLAG